MKTLLLAVALLAVPAFAQDAADAGVLLDAGFADAGLADGGVSVVDLVNGVGASPGMSVKAAYLAIKSGQGWLAAAILLVLFVGLVRVWGKKLHDWLPDAHWADKPLIFIFDTKLGGWLLNWFTAVAGCLGTAWQAGMPVDGASWRVALLASLSGTTLIELGKDIGEWWEKQKAKKAAEAAAKAAVVASPDAAPATPAAADAALEADTKP